MKKLAVAMLALLMVLLCAVAVAEDDPYKDLGNFTMMVGHAQPDGNPRFVSMESFAADVAEKTHGHVTVEVFGNGQLGTEKEMLEQVVGGVIQGMRGGQFDFSPRLLMFTLPFFPTTAPRSPLCCRAIWPRRSAPTPPPSRTPTCTWA